MQGTDPKCLRNFNGRSEVNRLFGNLNIESIIFKCITVKEVVRKRPKFVWIEVPVAGSFEHGNNSWGFLLVAKFLYSLKLLLVSQ
jgi:hypothetical protein